ncbi:hypothetical protein Tco_0367121 [Tanacetum coccineum]
MSSLAEFAILNGADNRPPMLYKLMYDLWKSKMELYMENRENGYLILESIKNGPLVWPMIEENGEIRRKRVPELSAPKKLQYEANVKATNIILQGVPADIYALVGHHRETLSQYYHIFSQLINDMHIYQMRLQQFQVNTKFLNCLPPEWSKFVTDVKLVKDLHVTNFDQLFAHLEHHEAHANEIRQLDEINSEHLMAMPSSEQSSVVNNSETEITSDSNIIPYSQSHSFYQTTKVDEVPKELPKVSMVNTSLKKLKHHLAGFDVVIKERTTATTITKGSWGFEHTKACFRDEIIPFVKALKDLFNTFDQYLIDELSEVQNVFHQMEQAVEQHRLESKTFEVKMNQVLNENERLLEQVINKDIVNIIMNSSVDNASVNVHECKKCLKLETELLNKKDFIEKETYDKLFRSFTTLEKHCISLEVDS